jgi:hypothetical protein
VDRKRKDERDEDEVNKREEVGEIRTRRIKK